MYITLFKWEKEKVKKVHSAVIPYGKDDIKGVFINLLAVMDQESSKCHYVCITSLNRLLNKEGQHKYNYCPRCVQPFQHQDKKKFSEHQLVCYGKLVQTVTMPKRNSVQKFTNYTKTEKLPYIAFGDIECYLEKCKEGIKHIPCAFGVYFCCSVDAKRRPLSNEYRVFTLEVIV